MRDRGQPERDRTASLEASGLVSLAAQEGEGEVEAVDLASPVLCDGAFTAGEEVLLQLVKAGQHLRVDAEHWATDAGVFVLAGGPVRTSASRSAWRRLSPRLISGGTWSGCRRTSWLLAQAEWVGRRRAWICPASVRLPAFLAAAAWSFLAAVKSAGCSPYSSPAMLSRSTAHPAPLTRIETSLHSLPG